MSIKKKGDYYYGESQIDIREELLRYSELNGYPTKYYADAVCNCGLKIFSLSIDDVEGAAVRQCTKCKTERLIGDSDEHVEEAKLESCECLCGSNSFEITVGVALYEDSKDVKWLYVGCRCFDCELTGCYGDWKNEYSDYRKLLDNI